MHLLGPWQELAERTHRRVILQTQIKLLVELVPETRSGLKIPTFIRAWPSQCPPDHRVEIELPSTKSFFKDGSDFQSSRVFFIEPSRKPHFAAEAQVNRKTP